MSKLQNIERDFNPGGYLELFHVQGHVMSLQQVLQRYIPGARIFKKYGENSFDVVFMADPNIGLASCSADAAWENNR